MKRIHCSIMVSALFVTVVFNSGAAFAWHDRTHMAIAQAAGYENWHNAAAADVTKTKAGDIEANNHWYNNKAGEVVTDAIVLSQARRYNYPGDAEGHLYGAIVASLQDYLREAKEGGKYAEYHLAFCAHYIGDLSMPFHNIPYGDGMFNNKDRHQKNDGAVESNVLNNIGRIQKNMYEIKFDGEAALARQIAVVANSARQLARKLEKESRDMARDEAYAQIYHSASLLKAILAYAKTQQ